MFATAQGHTITLSKDIASALTQDIKGYRVQLHALPQYEFKVEADSGEEAVRLAVALCRKEGKQVKSDAATFQRI